MKNIIVLIISLFWIGMSFGQVVPIEGSLKIQKEDFRGFTKFKKYVNSILEEKEETITLETVPKKYRIMYSASCSYLEHWANDSCAYGTHGKSIINDPPAIDTLSTDAMFAQIKPAYFCAENPYIYTEVETIFVLKNGELFNADTTSQFEIDIIPSYGWRYTPKITYDNGRFLILETTTLDGTEEELLNGITTTFILESLE